MCFPRRPPFLVSPYVCQQNSRNSSPILPILLVAEGDGDVQRDRTYEIQQVPAGRRLFGADLGVLANSKEI